MDTLPTNSISERMKAYKGSKLNLQYKFKHPIESVWEQLKSQPLWQTKQSFFVLLPDFYKNEGVVERKNYWDIGAKYALSYKSHSIFTYETLDIVDDFVFKKHVYECWGTKYEFGWITEYCLYRDSVDNTTFLTYNLTYDRELGSPILDAIKFEKEELFKINDKYIKKHRKYESEQVESILIKQSKENIWNKLISFRDFKDFITLIADEIIIEGGGKVTNLNTLNDFKKISKTKTKNQKITKKNECINEVKESQLTFDKNESIKLNSLIKFKYIKSNLIISSRVTTLDCQVKEEKWKLELTMEDIATYNTNVIKEEEFYPPKQVIRFEITEIADRVSLFVFSHIFVNEKIKLEDLYELQYNKIKILKMIKKCCQKSEKK